MVCQYPSDMVKVEEETGGCSLAVTWSNCCEDDPSSNPSGHAPPLREV
jgi:hypothetical protein